MPISSFEKPFQIKIYRELQKLPKFRVKFSDEINLAFGSCQGLVREENQDSVLVARVKSDYQNEPDQYIIAALCDGMGGMAHGKECADLALSVFTSSFILNRDLNYPQRLEFAINDANKTVFRKFSGKGGSTLSAFMISNSGFKVAMNVGDSRIYKVLANGEIKQISVDDTLEAQLANIKESINIQSRELGKLSNFVGIKEKLETKLINFESSSEIQAILITTDGIHKIISEDLLKNIIVYGKEPKSITERLIELSEWLGGKDNATMIYVPLTLNFGVQSIPHVKYNVEILNLYQTIDFCMIDEVKYSNGNFKQENQKPDTKTNEIANDKMSNPKNIDTQKRKVASKNNPKSSSPNDKHKPTQFNVDVEIREVGDFQENV